MAGPEQQKHPPKKPYTTPKLVVHGKVGKLTQSGTAGKPEVGTTKLDRRA